MDDEIGGESLRRRLTRTGEDALGKLAQDLLENPLISSAITRAFEAREKAVQAQEVALGALNLPSAADVERLTRRVRSVSQRLEGIEDAVDRLDERLESIERGVTTLNDQLDKLGKSKPAKASRANKGETDRTEALEGRLEQISRDIDALRRVVAPGEEPPPRAQERLSVSEA